MQALIALDAGKKLTESRGVPQAARIRIPAC